MGYIQGADRNQVILLPDTLDDYVGGDNEVRAIDAFIDSLDISLMGFKADPAKEGRPGYDPRDMLKLYMYGYLNHIRSSRRLQKEASRNVELMWLLRKVVSDFRCIADFRKDNAKSIREVFRAFVRLCNKAGMLSHESVVIDGSKFRAVNADNKSYVSSNAKKVLLDVEEKISRYMKELDEADAAESRPGALTKEDIVGVLDYLERRKAQLTEALEQMAGSGENHICTTDPESRLMKTRDGIRPSFNVQTAVEAKNHLIVHYDVTSECTDWHLLGDGINASKAALGVENLEGIADRGYSNDEEILQCLLNGDTPTTHPNKGEKSRMFRFQKTDTEVTGEVVSYAEMKAQGGLEKAPVEVRREPPLHPYFERDIEKDIVICPMGQTLFYAGPGHPNGKKDPCIRRYHRLSACLKCPNKCTPHKRRIVSFKEGETRKEEAFYEKARENRIVRKTSRRFKVITLSEEESSWDEWVILRFYPNQQHLRKRNTVVEHPYGTVKRWHGVGYLLTKGKQKAAAEMGLSFLAYNFRRVDTLSKYLQLPVEQIRKLSEGDVGFLPEDSIYRFNIFNKITFLYLSAVEDKDLKLCAFLKVLVSYHGLSKRTVAKMAGVEVKNIERMLSNPPKKVPEDIKYKVAVTVMSLRFFLKDCEQENINC
ncbi:hypothetical protein IMSAGC002_03660 [Lachnospiraceae bacterium]|nr:hypothetical protein IMSAGC002_03660 [Lachnospiraceae bacterium]